MVIVILREFIPSTSSRILNLIYSFIYAIIGGITYFSISIKTNLLYDILGKDIIDKVLKKLKLKKSK